MASIFCTCVRLGDYQRAGKNEKKGGRDIDGEKSERGMVKKSKKKKKGEYRIFTCESVRRKLYVSVLKRNKIFRTRCYISSDYTRGGGVGNTEKYSASLEYSAKTEIKKTWTVRKGIFIIIIIYFPSVFKTPRPNDNSFERVNKTAPHVYNTIYVYVNAI